MTKVQLSQLIMIVTPLVTPILVIGVKKWLAMLPKFWWPIAAVVFGAVLDTVNYLATGGGVGPAGGAVLGGAGVALREIVDQLKTATRHRHPAFHRTLALTVLVAVLASCASLPPQKVLVLSAISLEAAGEEFITVNELWNKLYDLKVITPKQYEPWRKFAKHFKFAYHEALGLWKAAKKSADIAKEHEMEAILQALTLELAKLASEAYRYLAKGG